MGNFILQMTITAAISDRKMLGTYSFGSSTESVGKKQFTPLILFKAQTDGLKIDEHRTSNVQHRMMNGKNEEANV